MKRLKQSTKDWLGALTIMGRIMIFVPIVIGFIMFISSSFWQNEIARESSIEGPSTVTLQDNVALEPLTDGASMIFICGTATLVYVAIKRFWQGLHGEGDAR